MITRSESIIIPLSVLPIQAFDSMKLLAVTIIMPVRNEADYIGRSLNSVLNQDYPTEYMQVLVVDGMSEDGTRQLVGKIMEGWRSNQPDLPYPPLLVDNKRRIAPTALNLGLTQAVGDIVIRVDGHCEIPPDYVRHCVQTLTQRGVDCVGGSIETIGETPTAQTIAAAMSSGFGVGGSTFRTIRDHVQLVDTLAFGAYTRAAIAQCGSFDEELVRNQDDEYNYRLRKMGGRILLDPSLSIRYYSRGTLGKLWSQYYQYGFWKVRVLQKHPQQMQPRQFAPPLFVAALVGGALLAPFSGMVRQVWFGLLVLYTIANLTASVLTAARQGWRHLRLLPIVYGILHVSYGLGFLAGLVRFVGRWSGK